MKKDTLVISGISSFVGANLAIEFSNKGFNVIGLISRSFEEYEYPRNLRLEICRNRGVSFYQLDLKENYSIKKFFQDKHPDYFIHHAAWTNNANSPQFDLNEAIKVNVKPLRTLYEELKKCSAKGIIITGTNQEYGDKETGFKEDDICMPTTQYGLSKLCMTITASQLCNEFKVPTRIARLFNPIGALDNPNKLLPCIIHKVSKDNKFDLSKCIQQRDFIYIKDLAEGYIKLVDDFKRKDFDIFNICSGEAITLKYLLFQIVKYMGKNKNLLQFGSVPMRIGEPLISFGNNKKAKELLGWNPSSIKDKVNIFVDEILNENDKQN